MDLEQTLCESCKKSLPKKSLILHIGKSKDCKTYYGKRYDDLKKEKNKERVKLWRKTNGKKELERQRELYKEDSSKREKKRNLWKEKQEKLENEQAEKNFERQMTVPVEKDDPFVIQCLFCSKSFEYTSILKHIGNTDLCKAFYGPKFEKMKTRHARIRKRIYREENGTNEELKKQRENYGQNQKLREEKQRQYQKRKEEDKIFELNQRRENFRINTLERVDLGQERHHSSNSTYSSKREWLSKCFDHFFDFYKDVEKKSKENLIALVDSMKKKYSNIEETIDKNARNVKDLIKNANPENKTPIEFDLILSNITKENFYNYGDDEIQNEWKDFFQNFFPKLEEIVKQAEMGFQGKMWHKSLTKIILIYKQQEKSYRTFDYFCLKETLCIICNKKSHRIDFDEDLAKKDPKTYTYHGDSEWELSKC